MLVELPLVEPVLGVVGAGLVGLVVLLPEPALPEVEPEVLPLIPELPLPDVLLPVESCCFRQSDFAVPLRLSQRLVAPVLPLVLGLVVLGLELEPLPVVCETDNVAKPASAAAMAMPSAFFIMNGLLGSWGRCYGLQPASGVPRPGFMVKSRAERGPP